MVLYVDIKHKRVIGFCSVRDIKKYGLIKGSVKSEFKDINKDINNFGE